MLAEKYKTLSLLTAPKCQPCISVILPFEPKMTSKAAIAHSLKIAAEKIKRDLNENYIREAANAVYKKFENVIERLDYATHKKSIAIYVSPEIEKVFYLNIPVNGKVMVDTSFEIRDIVLNKKDEHEFLLLVISGKKETIYVGDGNKLKLVVSNNITHRQISLPEQVANFEDIEAIKETRLKNFLHYIDKQLSHILQIYPLPVFIMTSKKSIGYFSKITKHHKSIMGFVHGNFDDVTESELQAAVAPQLQDWKHIREMHIMNCLKIAEDNHKLTTGIHDVWMQAKRLHRQLLIVEKDFYCSAFVIKNGEIIFSNNGEENQMIAKDAVDDIIEKVLKNGGDVEFVNALKDYNRIALVEQPGND